MITVDELWLLFQNVWATGNSWVRIAFGACFMWILAVIVISTTGIGWMVSVATIVAFIGMGSAIVFLVDPAILTVVNSFSFGKKAIGGIIVVFAAELTASFYLSVVPVNNNLEMLPIIIVGILAYIFLKVVGAFVGRRKVEGLFVGVLILITLSFFLPNTSKALKGNGEFGIKGIDARVATTIRTGHLPQTQAILRKINPVMVDAGRDKPLVFVGDGTYHTFQANHPWILMHDGGKEMKMTAGFSWWKGAGSGGYIGAKGIVNGTVIEIERRS